jgi:hypothetical protein
LGFDGFRSVVLLTVVLLTAGWGCPASMGQRRAVSPKAETRETASNLAQLQNEYVTATREYKASLGKLLAIYEKNIKKAEERLGQSQALFSQGLISRNQLAESEQALADAKDKVIEVQQQIANADTQIANTLLEAEAIAKLAKLGQLRKGALLRTTSYVRYNGTGGWGLGDAWKIQRFFQDSFKRPLPIAVFGQGAIHDRWRLDHRNSLDVSLNPDGVEGQTLMGFLRANGIPFLAFRSAIPGTATGPHIHIGHPSHRY